MWGGRLPTWKEFKEASAQGNVRINKTVAAEAVFFQGVPKSMMIVFGIVTMWAAFLIVPVTAGLYFFGLLGGWWIFASFIAAWLLIKISRYGHCVAIKMGAERNEELYKLLVENGAFLFEPHK